ncbi:FAD linked oxidase domain-containing protein [Bradyrhizobium oligotrophicum S58]|uniref:FAD linked oxidase domain-containing protein n=1 Tax=Bradyrhizobium oligotrophicum S58 TaxID=1245469 RepID=M4ZSY5_9BRAD|nr:FAD linked oxidase domain-containing protein [Bradyrhizobium oligotrophicum S58]
MQPDPACSLSRCSGFELAFDGRLDQRTVPPWADRHQRVVDQKVVAIGGNAELTERSDPGRDLLAIRAAILQIVIARADQHARLGREQRQVLLDHDDLRADVDDRSEIERVPGEYDRVEMAGGCDQPVELRQRVVKIGNDETAHEAPDGARRSKSETRFRFPLSHLSRHRASLSAGGSLSEPW